MSYWHGSRVLVTGAGGFIGSHLPARLARAADGPGRAVAPDPRRPAGVGGRWPARRLAERVCNQGRAVGA